ncbi:transposase family protein, partial [Streptomyces sp. NPDC002722]|uniref:helix-turn-helix domain-containing protein n=1 Tax=unclassified Streptomyces TaxID=2593676 RepID=UPI0033262FCB
MATLIHLRHGATHEVLACWFGVARSSITRAIGKIKIRPLLAEHGCTIDPGVRNSEVSMAKTARRADRARKAIEWLRAHRNKAVQPCALIQYPTSHSPCLPKGVSSDGCFRSGWWLFLGVGFGPDVHAFSLGA